MREPRNPFVMRTSEHIESDATFLRLFGPGVLDLLPAENLWSRVQIFRSAPGGGKTSLFRVFTPSSLLILHESRANEDYKDLYQRMKDLDVVSDSGPQLLGIMLSCAKNYATLEDLSFDQSRKERLLYSLLNARLILASLRGALALKKLEFPADLQRLKIVPPSNGDLPIQIPIPGSGKDLYEWAYSIEQKVCKAIDSFDPASYEVLEGHDTLHVLSLLRPGCFTVNGLPVASRILVMLDDVHKLTALQRQKLIGALFDLRPSIGVWIAERLEALNPEELIASGATTGREYGEPVNLEDFWRPSGNSKRFENIVTNIADRRVKSARDVQVGPFAASLQESLDGSEFQDHFQKALTTTSERVRKRVTSAKRYAEWVRTTETLGGTPREQATAWRVLEILIERDIRKAQTAFDFALPPEELEKHEASAVRAAAEFFISQEFNIPYFLGISRLATLSSSNIEQFLAFSGELFEEIISAELLRRQTILTPNRQQTILKKLAQQRWEEIPRRIPNGRDVQRLLEAIHQCARWETNKPNAPYPPGVTGIALSMANRDKLINRQTIQKHPQYERLVFVLSACLSHNLLEVSLDRRQGQKGKTWMILYLNRWLCLHFGLPIQYGGWRPKSIDELCKWLDQGFRPPKQPEGDLI